MITAPVRAETEKSEQDQVVMECIETCDRAISALNTLIEVEQERSSELEKALLAEQNKREVAERWYNDKELWLVLGVVLGIFATK